jgi:rhodanese-related sulfurtransferase
MKVYTGVEMNQSDCRQLDTAQAEEMINDNGALVVDVREPHEYAAGSIPNAQLIPLRQFGGAIDNLKQHGGRPIILSCRSGSRSRMACRYLKENGFDNVYNLDGGILAWRLANRPLA